MLSAAWWVMLATGLVAGDLDEGRALQRDAFGRLVAEVRLNGTGPYRFLLDTGSSLSSIAPRLAARLSLPPAGRVRATSVGTSGTLPLVRARVVELAGLPVAVPWMVLLPDDPRHPLSQFDGVIGQDALSSLPSYLIDVTSATLWANPSRRLLERYAFAPVDVVSSSGPLTVRGEDGARWTIDSGASHVVLFGRLAARQGSAVSIVSMAGLREARWSPPSSVRLGAVTVEWERAVEAPVAGRPERGLLPLVLFDAIHVDNRTVTASVVARGSRDRRYPDVAAHRRALEDDGRVVRRPGGVAHVPVR
jgi:hypothetical protein